METKIYTLRAIKSNSLCSCQLLFMLSDWHLIAPYNIIPESQRKVTRMKEMITHKRGSYMLTL